MYMHYTNMTQNTDYCSMHANNLQAGLARGLLLLSTSTPPSFRAYARSHSSSAVSLIPFEVSTENCLRWGGFTSVSLSWSKVVADSLPITSVTLSFTVVAFLVSSVQAPPFNRVASCLNLSASCANRAASRAWCP